MKFLVRKAPENFIRTVNDEISSLLNRHFDSYFPEAAYWEDMDKFSMPVEISDKGKDYEVKAELPGVKKEDLDIDIDKNYIVINAKKEEEKEEDEKSYKKSCINIWIGKSGKNGKKILAITILKTSPKSELKAIFIYFMIFPYTFLPSITPS